MKIKHFQNLLIYKSERVKVMFIVKKIFVTGDQMMEITFLKKKTSQKHIMILKKEYLLDGLIGLKNQRFKGVYFGNIALNFQKIFKKLKEVS